MELYSYEADELAIIVPDQIIVGVPTPYQIQFYHKKRLLQGKALLNVRSGFKLNKDLSTIEAAAKGEEIIEV